MSPTKSLVSGVFALIVAAPAFAHHPSPAEPDIGDMMGMHDAAIESMLETRVMTIDLDEVRSDNVGDNIGGNDSMLESVSGGNQ